MEIIFSQFWRGKKCLFEPSFSSFKEFFPSAKYTLYTDYKGKVDGFDEVRDMPAIVRHYQPDWGWRMKNIAHFRGLLDSDHEVAIAVDHDLRVVSEDVLKIVPLVKRFGVCFSASGRGMVKVDTVIGRNGRPELANDDVAYCHCVDSVPLFFSTRHNLARRFLEELLWLTAMDFVRIPVNVWRAALNIGFAPCVLPPQWCVDRADVGCGNEIILHVGNQEVFEYYEHHKVTKDDYRSEKERVGRYCS